MKKLLHKIDAGVNSKTKKKQKSTILMLMSFFWQQFIWLVLE